MKFIFETHLNHLPLQIEFFLDYYNKELVPQIDSILFKEYNVAGILDKLELSQIDLLLHQHIKDNCVHYIQELTSSFIDNGR